VSPGASLSREEIAEAEARLWAMSRSGVFRAKPYRYQGNADWDPARIGPIRTPSQRKADRAVRFARLRGEGLTVAQASRRMGISTETGRAYERERRGGS
jgi:hypothetical protein